MFSPQKWLLAHACPSIFLSKIWDRSRVAPWECFRVCPFNVPILYTWFFAGSAIHTFLTIATHSCATSTVCYFKIFTCDASNTSALLTKENCMFMTNVLVLLFAQYWGLISVVSGQFVGSRPVRPREKNILAGKVGACSLCYSAGLQDRKSVIPMD